MRIITALAIAVLATTAYGSDLGQRVVTPSGVAIHLPEGWQTIPHPVLVATFEEVAKQNPHLPKQTYDAGFQAPAPDWLTYPYLLVQIHRTGRIPDAALEKYPKLNEAFDKAMQESTQAASVITDAAMATTVFDSSARILWTSASMNYTGVGTIQVLGGGHLCEEGFVWVFAYAPEEEFPKYESLLRRIISSVEVPDGMAYVPRATDHMPWFHAIDWNQAATHGMAGAVVGGLVTLLAALTRKKKKKEDSPPPN